MRRFAVALWVLLVAHNVSQQIITYSLFQTVIGASMANRTILPSLKLLLLGSAFFIIFALVAFVGEMNEASLITRIVVFIGLIPPPVCFGAGIFLAFTRELPTRRSGAWANAAAVLVHGILAFAILEQVLA